MSKLEDKGNAKDNPESSFTIRDLAKTIWKMLDISVGDDIELQRDRQDPNRIMLVLHRKKIQSQRESSPVA